MNYKNERIQREPESRLSLPAPRGSTTELTRIFILLGFALGFVKSVL